MKSIEDFELVLNHITASEHQLRFKEDNFEEYKQMAYLWLNRKSRHLFAEDILSQYKSDVDQKKILAQNPDQYVPGMHIFKNGTREKAWYDIFGMDIIEPDDFLFDYFFVCKIRHIDLLAIDNYLNYHLKRSFNNNHEKFSRFLQLSLRKHIKLLKRGYIDSVLEWIANFHKPSETKGLGPKTKGKPKRTAGDELTSLNLEETVLLIHFLKEQRIILKDEYLSNKQAGEAFSVLTSYSADTLRMELGKLKLNRNNLTSLSSAAKKLYLMIQKELDKKTPS